MRRAAPLLLVLVLVGCGSGGKARISRQELPTIILQAKDVPGSWTQFGNGKQVMLDAPPGPRHEPTRFDREGGWISRYRGDSTVSPLVVESRGDLFKSPSGAKEDLAAYRAQLKAGLVGSGASSTLLPSPKLGEGAVAGQLRQGSQVFLVVAWRRSNATASVTVEGPAATMHLADVLALARKQDRHLARAAASPL